MAALRDSNVCHAQPMHTPPSSLLCHLRLQRLRLALILLPCCRPLCHLHLQCLRMPLTLLLPSRLLCQPLPQQLLCRCLLCQALRQQLSLRLRRCQQLLQLLPLKQALWLWRCAPAPLLSAGW